MKSDELIAILSKTTPITRSSINVFIASLLIFFVSILLIAFSYGLRPDFSIAITTAHFWYKTLFLFGLSILSAIALHRLFHPTGKADHFLNSIAGLWIMTTALSILEISYTDRSILSQNIISSKTLFCVGYISILGVISMICLTMIARNFAPIDSKKTGALIGFGAGVFTAFGYSFHCMVDFGSYLLIAYGFPIFTLSFIGYFILPRFLKW